MSVWLCETLGVTGDLLLFVFKFNLNAGGHSISLGLCPMKLPVKWDIQLGQPDVPASIRNQYYNRNFLIKILAHSLFIIFIRG